MNIIFRLTFFIVFFSRSMELYGPGSLETVKQQLIQTYAEQEHAQKVLAKVFGAHKNLLLMLHDEFLQKGKLSTQDTQLLDNVNGAHHDARLALKVAQHQHQTALQRRVVEQEAEQQKRQAAQIEQARRRSEERQRAQAQSTVFSHAMQQAQATSAARGQPITSPLQLPPASTNARILYQRGPILYPSAHQSQHEVVLFFSIHSQPPRSPMSVPSAPIRMDDDQEEEAGGYTVYDDDQRL